MACTEQPKRCLKNKITTWDKTRKQKNYIISTHENIKINILYLNGEETVKKYQQFEKLRIKLSKQISDLSYLVRCRNNNVIPSCATITHHINNKKINRILCRASLALLRNLIQQKRKTISEISQKVLHLHLQLSDIIHPAIWQVIQNLLDSKIQNYQEKIEVKHKKKLTNLLNNIQPAHNKIEPTEVVKNISSQEIDEHTVSALAKGFNYAITPCRIPTEDIISAIEPSIQHLEHIDAEEVRQEVVNILKNCKPPKQNLTKRERMGLKNIKQNSNVVVLPADKGNTTVIMDITDYQEKINKLLEEDTYKAIKTDPTTYLEKTTKQKIMASNIPEELKKKLIPREKSSRIPKLYGLPKIHKTGIPLRPIVSATGSPVQPLAKYLAKQLQPLAEASQSYIKNSHHLLQILKNQQTKNPYILASLDVTSLFTNVPIEETINILRTKYKIDEDILTLTSHCLNNTYFSYNNNKFRQIYGAPMGSALSPVIANIFMTDLEQKAINNAPKKPLLWVRYVDDILIIWPHSTIELKHFLLHVNSMHPKIKFTIEIEENNCLPFLDVLLERKQDGSIGHRVYRKKTNTNRYLHADSHHHPSQKNGIINTLLHRSKTLTDDMHKAEEIQKIKTILQKNGYSKYTIEKIDNKHKTSTKDTATEKNQLRTITLPYIKGTTDKIKKVLQKHDIKTTFKPAKTIRNLLGSPKDHIALENQGIYKIPCKNCDKSYIGQTNRRISTRIKEHELAIKNQNINSVLFLHKHNLGHTIDFKNAECIKSIENPQIRNTREAIEIIKNPNPLNIRDESLPQTWLTILRN